MVIDGTNHLRAENNITGEILLELDNATLKEMEVKTVGERVRILTAVRHLRQECYSELAYCNRMAKVRTCYSCNLFPGTILSYGFDRNKMMVETCNMAHFLLHITQIYL
jgi:hypothetical protein